MAKLTKEKVKQALEVSLGVVAIAARRLGVSRQGLHKAIKRFGLEGYLEELREEATDEVEHRLIQAALEGKPWAVMFFLKTLGRHRGYVERQEVAQASKLEIELVEVPGDPLARPPAGRG
ncbi:helix-turn-helix domain-containing protein [Thermus sp.]|uniref:helix-turn-helix domain-containing protein n=1 Tax=Thermus sp. TaxID=275 RepID=UPI0025F885E4|nr:helix-turn-helix domain-containing protein [Thermus sp.]MCS6867786.1 helix-turn-helix domain-containing protein [Thermus sp.]MCX7850028.1 helix-turn-helix domain-containing protein [Thermus sp.]MDW8358848.1 helix-turn-helix domain-containing protein [Thermus sp.]